LNDTNSRKSSRTIIFVPSCARNWRFLRLALEKVPLQRCHSKLVPYLIAMRFFRNVSKPRSVEDVVLIDMEKQVVELQSLDLDGG
jgi:hypothetical protein